MKKTKLIAISLTLAVLAAIACRVFADILISKTVTTQGEFYFAYRVDLTITPLSINWGNIDIDGNTVERRGLLLENPGDVPLVLGCVVVSASITPDWFIKNVHFSVKFGAEGATIYPGVPLETFLEVTLHPQPIKSYVIENYFNKGLNAPGNFGFDVTIHGATA